MSHQLNRRMAGPFTEEFCYAGRPKEVHGGRTEKRLGDVLFSYSHSREKLERLAKDAGTHATAGTPAEAAVDADAVILAVHWSRPAVANLDRRRTVIDRTVGA